MRSGGLRSAARAAARQGDWHSASRHYRDLLRTDRATAGDCIQLGHALKELGSQNEALTAYRDAADRHPLHPDAQRQFAFYLRRLGRKEEALDVMARTLALEPNATDVQAEMAAMHVTDPGVLDGHFLRGILAGSDAKAVSSFRLIGRALAERSLIQARRRARAYDWRSAELHYREVLRHTPYRNEVYVQLGHALLEEKRPADALACYRRALVATPRKPDLYLYVAHALKALDRQDSALNAYLTAWRLKPGFELAYVEIRALRPDIDAAALLDGETDPTYAPDATNGRLRSAARNRLMPPRWLNDRQMAAFKYVAGAIVYKD